MPERLADTCARLLTIKKSALAMRKPEAAPESGSMSPAKADAAAPPATDKSPAAKPDAKVARTEGEEKEETKAEAPPPFVFTPSTPVNTDGDAKAPAPFQFAGSTPTEATDAASKAAPFSFSSATSFSFTSPAFKSPFTFAAPTEKKEGEETPKSMFATWTPAAGSGVTFKPLDSSAAAPGSVFGTSTSETTPSSKAEETPRVSGEEDEESVFTTRGRVFVTTKREDGTPYWREHGKGPIKINVHKETKRARIVMRTDGTFQLKVNMRIFSEMGLKQLNDISTFVSGFEGDMEPVSYLIKTRIKQESAALFEALEAQKKAATTDAPAQEEKSEEKADEKADEKAEADKAEQEAPQASGEAEKAEEKATGAAAN